MFKRLNERQILDDQQQLLVEDYETTIPQFQHEMPVKSMDLSGVGFSDRYENALSS